MVDESLRISVIGAQTAAPESPAPYTVYRTVVTYGGECYERLLRFSEFYRFKKKLKLRKSTSAPVKFPSKTWSRKSSLEDDVIEARQVMLNEFVKGLSKADLAPQSQQQLMKLLKIGKFEDGSGRVSELSSYKASFVKSDRGELDAILEAEDDIDKSPTNRRKSSIALDRAATLTATSVAFPAVTSNATTVLTEDERSNFGSRGRIISEDAVEEEDAITVDSQTRTAPRRSTSTIPPSSYSDLLLQRPHLKASQSLPGRRSKRVEFPNEPATESNGSGESEVDGIESPTLKYRDRISTQLSAINRLLSESEAETEAETESSRSIPTQSSNALTA